MNESCLERRLSRFVELTDAERTYIQSIEEGKVEIETPQSIDALVDGHLCVLDGGWAVSEHTADRTTTITRVYLPGEIIGLAELGVEMAPEHSNRMLTEGGLCLFKKERIGDMIGRLPRLAALMMALSGLDQMTLRDRLGHMATASAEERLMHFLLDLRARLAVANVGSGNRFRVPFTQEQIGSAIGATSVTVNKTIRALRANGMIEIERPYYRILDRDEMERRCSFNNRYEHLDQSWFPDAR